MPAFFGSWFVFPRNDQLDDDCCARIEHADYLYVSHLHGDHLDEPWLRDAPAARHRRAAARLPDPRAGAPAARRSASPTSSAPTTARSSNSAAADRRDPRRDEHHRRPGRRLGAGRQRRRRSRIVNQNDCRTTDLDALRAHGPVDLHWLQYSGAIWYPMVYDVPPRRDARARRRQGREPARPGDALRRGGRRPGRRAERRPAVLPRPRAVRPQRDRRRRADHLRRPAGVPRPPRRGRPPRRARRSPARRSTSRPTAIDGRPPARPTTEVDAIFTDKARYLAALPGRLDAVARRAQGRRGRTPTTPTCSPRCRRGGSRCWRWRRRCATRSAPACLLRAGDLEVLIDFPAGEVRPVRRRAVPLPVRDRPRAGRDRRRRAGGRLEQLAVPVVPVPGVARRRVQRVGLQLLQVAVGRADAAHRGRGGAPARPADARPSPTSSSATGSCSAAARTATPTSPCSARSRTATLTCTLHGWRFDLETGRCLTAADHPLRVRRRDRGSVTLTEIVRASRRTAAARGPRRGCPSASAAVPDEVHRLHGDPDAAVRRRVVGHAVRAVHGDAADEVLRPVDLAEVALPPALRALAVDLCRPSGVSATPSRSRRECSGPPRCTARRCRSRC